MKPKGRDGSKGARARRKGQLLAALGLAESYVPEKPVMPKNKVRPKTINAQCLDRRTSGISKRALWPDAPRGAGTNIGQHRSSDIR